MGVTAAWLVTRTRTPGRSVWTVLVTLPVAVFFVSWKLLLVERVGARRTLAAAAGHQVEKSLHDAMEANKGKYVLIVEGAIPEKDGGIYCKVAGKTAIDSLNEVAAHAGAIIETNRGCPYGCTFCDWGSATRSRIQISS